MNFEDELFELYVRDYRIEELSYKWMGKLLERERIKKRIDYYDIHELYIYGGGYLGVQLYNAVCDMVNVIGVVDKKGILSVDVNGIHTISLNDMRNEYNGEKVIITPVKYYENIKNDLKEFVDEGSILFLGDFLEGIR